MEEGKGQLERGWARGLQYLHACSPRYNDGDGMHVAYVNNLTLKKMEWVEGTAAPFVIKTISLVDSACMWDCCTKVLNVATLSAMVAMPPLCS